MQRFFLACFLVAGIFASASDIKYPVSAIPETLKKNANVVKRMEEIRFEIVNLGEAILHKKVAYTILNENGDRYAAMVVNYDKERKVSSFDGTLYDANGNVLRKAKNKDIRDFSAVQDISLFDDNRVKVLDFTNQFYPYTVEFETEVKYNNTYMLPEWFPQSNENMSVESSMFSFVAPTEYAIRFKAFNYKEDPVTTTEKNKQVKTWKVNNLASIKRLFASPNWNELTTCVYFAPSEFEIAGHKGNASTWQELGKFQIALNQGRDELPDNTVQKIKGLINGIDDEREKVKVLYNYLQKNTRYISIQLGIGGLQPFEAKFVDQKGYGDCKALSNYMYSLLKAAGIKSYYTWVRGGDDPDDEYLMEDFPSDQFNHIILCVPMQKDSMWLECTSQDVPAGYMGQFTGNRKALLITEDGGKLVSTPRYALSQNILKRTIKAHVGADGNLSMKIEANYGGTQQDELSMIIHNLSKDKVQKILQRNFELSTYNVNEFNYQETKATLPQLNEQLDISVSGYATVSGKRLFITPNILNRAARKIDVDEQRTVDLVLHDEWRDEDNYEIEIPDGYQLEAMPQNVSLKTKFGMYSCSTKLDGNKIIYHRVREQYSGRFPAKDQNELAKYYDDIYKADRSKTVFVKKVE
jgi:hypothetical protein